MEILSGIIIQHHITWENPEANRTVYDHLLRSYDQQTDLVVLPEMFTTGFSMACDRLAEDMNGDTVKWLKSKSIEIQTAICGSIICRVGDQFFNRFLFSKPDGEMHYYDKRHLFGMAGEDRAFSHGTERNIIEYNGWKIRPIICYDLRFPVWCRNDMDYDALICVANWPSPRIAAWDTLLRSRAIENQSYVIGCNRIGLDYTASKYPGHSQVLNPFGDILQFSDKNKTEIIPFSLQKKVIANCRGKLPFLLDRDTFSIKE